MKLNPQSQLGLAFDLNMRLNIFKLQKGNMDQSKVTQEEQLSAFKQIEDLFSDNDNQFYVFRETALSIAKRIKLDKGKLEDFSFLRNVKDKKVTYLMGKNMFYRWVKIRHIIFVGCVKIIEDAQYVPPQKHMLYWLFKINTDTGELMFPEDSADTEFEEMMMQFLRMFIFAELSELETVVLKPKEKTGTRKAGKYINDCTQGIRIVDSTWNKVMILKEGFSVSGHLRLQRFGRERKDAKLILIEEFKKSGYIRRAPKELANQEVI